jgi:hypothetical protein
LQLSVALGEHDPDAIDYYYGPEDWVAQVRAHPPPLSDIRKGALDLAGKLKSDDFLTRQLKAIAARAELLQGARRSFDDEARAFFSLEIPASPDAGEFDEARRQIERLLPGSGTLARRYVDFDAQFTISGERVPAVMDLAIQACRERTLRHLKLPSEESVQIEYVSDKPWNAFSSYKGHFHSVIRINTDFAITIDRALALACHETYPGHHVYNTLVDSNLVTQQHRFDLMVQPTFSPQGFSSEAMATNAADLAFSGEDRLQFERDVLFPAAGTNTGNVELYLRINRLVGKLDGAEPEIARGFIDGKLEWVRAAAELEEKTLMVHTDATLKYQNEYRTYVLTYTVGRNMATSCYAGLTEADRWRLFQRLILGQSFLKECAKLRQDSLDKFWR